MKNEVHWMLEATIKDGQAENFKAVMQEMVEASLAEPGTTNYEWFLKDDGKTLHVYERYVDSAAVMHHVDSFHANFADRFLAIIEPTSFICYGNPNDAARTMLDGFGAVYMNQVGGFAR